MKDIIKNLIETAENITEDINTQLKILDEVQSLLYQLATTINCPSDWRSIAEELAEEYKNNNFIYETLALWNYAE